MGARQYADFRNNRAHIGEAASVNAFFGIENTATHNIAFQALKRTRNGNALIGAGIFGDQFGIDRIAQLGDFFLTRLFVGFLIGGFQPVFSNDGNLCFQLAIIIFRHVARLFGGFFGHANTRINHRLELFMAKHHSAQHHIFRQFIGFRFHHQHSVLRAGDNQIKRCFFHLLNRRIEHIFAIDKANTGAANRPLKRHTGNRQSGRDGNQSDNIGVIFKVMADHSGNHLRFVFKAFDKKRADRTVNQARDQSLFFARASFALKIAARHFTGGIGFFLVIHGQWEKIQPRFRASIGNHGCQNAGFSICGQHGTISLTRNAPGFQCQRATAPFKFFTGNIKHLSHPSTATRPLHLHMPVSPAALRLHVKPLCGIS